MVFGWTSTDLGERHGMPCFELGQTIGWFHDGYLCRCRKRQVWSTCPRWIRLGKAVMSQRCFESCILPGLKPTPKKKSPRFDQNEESLKPHHGILGILWSAGLDGKELDSFRVGQEVMVRTSRRFRFCSSGFLEFPSWLLNLDILDKKSPQVDVVYVEPARPRVLGGHWGHWAHCIHLDNYVNSWFPLQGPLGAVNANSIVSATQTFWEWTACGLQKKYDGKGARHPLLTDKRYKRHNHGWVQFEYFKCWTSPTAWTENGAHIFCWYVVTWQGLFLRRIAASLALAVQVQPTDVYACEWLQATVAGAAWASNVYM